MKKLMLTAAVMAAGAAMAIESANVVGYAASALNDNGYTLSGGQFLDVGAESISLTSIKPVGAGDGEVAISTIDDRGYTLATYLWADWGDPDIGWQDDSMSFIDDTVKVVPGGSFWIQCDTTGVTLQSAGQVPSVDVAVALNDNGYTLAGNPFPAEVALNTVIAQGAGDGDRRPRHHPRAPVEIRRGGGTPALFRRRA